MSVVKVYSLWQPYASLAVKGLKIYETRGFPPPAVIPVGQRFAIAATKQIKVSQQELADHPRMLHHCDAVGLAPWRTLPRGSIIGTVLLKGFFPITKEFIRTLSDREYQFGDWQEGRYAWELAEPKELTTPIPARGSQGPWTFTPSTPNADETAS